MKSELLLLRQDSVMHKNYVVVTTIIDPYRTSSLVDKYLLDEDIAEVWIYDNGHKEEDAQHLYGCLLYTSPSPRDS